MARTERVGTSKSYEALDLITVREILGKADTQVANTVATRMGFMSDVAQSKVNDGITEALDRKQEKRVIKRYEELFVERGLPGKFGRKFGKLMARYGAKIQQDQINRLTAQK